MTPHSPKAAQTNAARLLVVHGVVTLAAGMVLFAAPGAIPGAVGVFVDPAAYLVCYLLGAAEIAIAVLSFGAARLQDASAVRLVSLAFIVLHVATAAAEAYAFTQGVSATIWANVATRAVVAALFAYYGIYRIPGQQVAPRAR